MYQEPRVPMTQMEMRAADEYAFLMDCAVQMGFKFYTDKDGKNVRFDFRGLGVHPRTFDSQEDAVRFALQQVTHPLVLAAMPDDLRQTIEETSMRVGKLYSAMHKENLVH